ncbi:MAG: cysteine desulfurase [Sediminibacterium sp.]|nr:cysteine desulfurase [Sediminibacterium sp.]
MEKGKGNTLDGPAIQRIRNDFPIFKKVINGQSLVYFDNGATVQKPLQVIQAIENYYYQSNANIHRGVHTLSREATELYETARNTVAAHFNVANPQQCVFTSGTTEGINLIAGGLSKAILRSGDEIILTAYEHHSNILPWQLHAQERGLKLKVIPLKSDQSLDIAAAMTLFTDRTKVLAVAHVSNTLGLITDLQALFKIAQQYNVITVVDGAQSSPHMPVNLPELDPDFFVCSAHKMYGPTGIGLLYMKEKWLTELPLFKTGGGTIKTVTFEHTEYAEGALRFEPGTPHISGAVGFAAAIDYMNSIDMSAIYKHESELVRYAQTRLLELPEVEVYGQSEHKAGVISFNVKGAHPFDVGTLLDKYGIAVRTGHHCTQPLMQLLGVQGTVRASFAIYNTLEEVEYFIEKLKRVITLVS